MNGILQRRVCFLVHDGMFLSCLLPFKETYFQLSFCTAQQGWDLEFVDTCVMLKPGFHPGLHSPCSFLQRQHLTWQAATQRIAQIFRLAIRTRRILWTTVLYSCLWAYFHSYTGDMDAHFLHFREFILHCCLSGTFCSTQTLRSVCGVMSFYTSCPSHNTWPSH